MGTCRSATDIPPCVKRDCKRVTKSGGKLLYLADTNFDISDRHEPTIDRLNAGYPIYFQVGTSS